MASYAETCCAARRTILIFGGAVVVSTTTKRLEAVSGGMTVFVCAVADCKSESLKHADKHPYMAEVKGWAK